jgi:hypothetical protein
MDADAEMLAEWRRRSLEPGGASYAIAVVLFEGLAIIARNIEVSGDWIERRLRELTEALPNING